MVEKWWISAIVGAIVFLIGLALLRWNVKFWRQAKDDSALEDVDRQHFYRRYRRRMQMSAMLMIVGLLVGVGELLGDWRKHPGPFAVYWGGVLLLLLWVVLLGFADMLSTAAHSRIALAELRYKQRALEQRLAEFKQRRVSNGRESE